MNTQLATCPYCGSRYPKLQTQLLSTRVICQSCQACGPRRRTAEQARELCFEKTIENQQLLNT